VEIFERQSKIFGERSIVVHDAENLTAGTVPGETTFAVDAGGAKAQGVTGDIDFAGDAFPQPAFPFARPDACNVLHLSHEFMSRRAAKIVVAAKNFDIGVADASEMDAN
jgi:hypothetical protein